MVYIVSVESEEHGRPQKNAFPAWNLLKAPRQKKNELTFPIDPLDLNSGKTENHIQQI
jgi:hypothetical protein